jgi:peptidoglycan/LPS O-acetylase OafA/YrhL
MKDLKYFENLDGWRVICFLMVFFFHSFFTTDAAILNSESYQFIKKDVFGNGNIGVNFFFVLSGFLITYLLLKEKHQNAQINIGKFIMRRVLRIWPLYFFCVIFGFFIFPFLKSMTGETPNETAELWSYLTFTSNFNVIKNGLPDSSSLGVLWSIAIEEQFYFIWPFIVYFLPQKKVIYPILFFINAHLIFVAYHQNDYMQLEHHSLSCSGDIALGALGAYLIFNSISFVTFFKQLNRWVILFIYVGFGALFFFRDELKNGSTWFGYIDRITIGIFILGIILEQSFSEKSFFKMSKFKVFSSLGKYTYGMYALHFIAILITIKLIPKLYDNTNFWSIFIVETLVSLLITILISIISYKLLEKPFLNLKRKFNAISE